MTPSLFCIADKWEKRSNTKCSEVVPQRVADKKILSPSDWCVLICEVQQRGILREPHFFYLKNNRYFF